jgi:hypothetical protein
VAAGSVQINPSVCSRRLNELPHLPAEQPFVSGHDVDIRRVGELQA